MVDSSEMTHRTLTLYRPFWNLCINSRIICGKREIIKGGSDWIMSPLNLGLGIRDQGIQPLKAWKKLHAKEILLLVLRKDETCGKSRNVVFRS